MANSVMTKKVLNKSKSEPSSRKNFECFICKVVVPGPYLKLVVHIKHVHYIKTSKRVSNPLMCGQNSCSAQFMSFRSYRHHLLECEFFQGDNVTSRTAVPQIESLTENESSNGSADVDFDVAEKPKVCDKQVQVAKLFLNLRTTFNVTNSALNFVSAEMTKILAEAAECPLSLIEDAFTNLNSQTNRSAFYEKHFAYKSPKQLLSLQQRRWANRFESNTLRKRIVPRLFHYIPIKGTLSSLFAIPKFRALYFGEQPSPDGRMRGHIDTNHYKSHELFKECPRALRIQIFNDDLEVCNSCGSKTKLHQLAMFCFCILIFFYQIKHLFLTFKLCNKIFIIFPGQGSHTVLAENAERQIFYLQNVESISQNVSTLLYPYLNNTSKI